MFFKLATKTIANMIKPFLNSIVSPSQSGFILGRLITDNVLVVLELNHFLKSRRGDRESHVAIKLDMSKAYDWIEQIFLERMLSRLGFYHRVVSLTMSCVSSVTYSFMLNGSQFGFLYLERGIHQGDLLSSYLFILCAEALSCLIEEKEARGEIIGVAVSNLLNKQGICWNSNVVESLFYRDDSDLIKTIALGYSWLEDTTKLSPPISRKVIENSDSVPENYVSSAGKLLQDFLNAPTARQLGPIPPTRWLAPRHNSIKVNFDAFVNRVKNGVGLEVITRNRWGHCVAWRTSF
ncbi:hypothetical protein Sango_2767700 [Sesamum angolense]|uniref:Reverse transcriptase domain-containing protein n=1 Tax=Sesamum angolense TaxID=2727404 RepID=A0AAE1W0U3_9LAMI|nr:hypothetical protein Sango_2767700 [Sesamum angolense]